MKPFEFVFLITIFLPVFLSGCQIGHNQMMHIGVTAAYKDKNGQDIQNLTKRLDDLIAQIDATGKVDAAELRDALVTTKTVLEGLTKNNTGEK